MKVLPTPPRLLQNAMECVGAIVLGAAVGVRSFSLLFVVAFPLDEEGASEAVRAVSRERESGEGVGGSRTGRGATTQERGWVAVWLRRAARNEDRGVFEPRKMPHHAVRAFIASQKVQAGAFLFDNPLC
jgi:hypothetical protein